MATINARIDDNLKAQAERVFQSLGLSTSAAISVFLQQVVKQNKIPFEIATSDEQMIREEAVEYQVNNQIDFSYEKTPEFQAYIQRAVEEAKNPENLVSSDDVFAEARRMIAERYPK